MDISLSQTITEEQYDSKSIRESRVMPRDVSINESSMRQADLDPMLISERVQKSGLTALSRRQ